MIDIKNVQEEATKEIQKEKTEKAKDQIKSKMRELDKAKTIVRNIERELQELYAEIGAGIN